MQKKKTVRNVASRAKKPTKSASIQGINFEPLEHRQLMAVVNIADFGGRPNDGANDIGALRAALNATKAGDTILFDGGVFDLSGFGGDGNGLDLPSNRTLKGQNGATLRGRDTKGPQLHIRGDNVTITGLTFDGGGVMIDKNGGMNQGIVIDYNVFKINTSGQNPNGITFTSGLRDSKITNNYFTGYGGAFAIYGYNYFGLTIANNELVNVTGGMHIDAFGGCGNLVVEQNFLTGIRGMGLEFQTQGGGAGPLSTNLVFQDNFYEKPKLSNVFSENWNTFAYSLIIDKSKDVTIRRNTVLAPERPDGVGVRIGFEVGGDNTLIEDNYVNGINHVLASNDGAGSSSLTVRNNKFMNYLQGIGGINPGAVRREGTNDASTKLTWDINRPKPGIGAKRYGGTNGQTPTPPPPPTGNTDNPQPPAETAPTGPTGLAAMATGATTVNLFWTDLALNESGYKVERSIDGQTWTEIATLGADATGYTAKNLTSGQGYSFRVRSFNGAGNSAWSNTASATPKAFDPDNGKYLSDLQWSSATNFWGSAERDMSNGEQKTGDGKVLSIDGKKYAKGLGVHAGSEIRYRLDGKYANFLSDIGIDDETGGNGAVNFEVWADGRKIYTSGARTAADGRKSINVDVRGKKELVLIVTNAGDSVNFGHADWADARLTAASGSETPEPTPPPVENGDFVYLSDIEWDSVTNGWGTPELDKSNGERGINDGKTLTLNGKTFAKGIGAHSTGDIRYSLNGKYSTFTAQIGLDDEVGDLGTVIFKVVADGETLFESDQMTGASETQSVNVDVKGKQELWLVVLAAGDNRDYDHANWADAKLTLTVPATSNNGVYLSDLNPTSQTNGWGPAEINSSVGQEEAGDGTAMRINRRVYTHGLGVHAGSTLKYDLNGTYDTFITDVGVDDEVGNNGTVTFEIWADGQKVYDSGLVTGADSFRTATINVEGKDQLWLIVTGAEDGITFDHANWANARLVA